MAGSQLVNNTVINAIGQSCHEARRLAPGMPGEGHEHVLKKYAYSHHIYILQTSNDQKGSANEPFDDLPNEICVTADTRPSFTMFTHAAFIRSTSTRR